LAHGNGNDIENLWGAWMSTFVRVVAVVGTAFAMLTTAGGVAAADSLAGQTYEKAAASVSGRGATPVVATVTGDRLAINDCIVVASRKSIFTDIGGSQRKAAVLMNLNCNEGVATPGSPGNSVASPEGRAAKKLIQTAANCSLPAQAENANCAKWCSEHDGMCTANF
jgi:hypothetical protein